MSHLFDHIRTLRRSVARSVRDDGYSTETILVASLLVVLALVVLTILAQKVTDKANSINLGLG